MKTVTNTFSRLLQWTEKYTKTDMTYLFSGSFWSTLNFLITVGFGFLIMIILANYVPKEVLGTYQFVLSVASILAVCTLSGVGTAITRSVAMGHEGVYRYGVRIKLKWSIFASLLSSVISAYYFFNGDSTLAIAFLIVGLATPLIESLKLYESFLKGKEAFKDTVTLGFWRKPLPLVAIATVAFVSDDLLLLLTAYFLGHVISYAIVYFQVHRKYQPPIKENEEAHTLSKHLSVITVASQLTSNLDKIAIWHFLGPVAVASFAIAQLTSRYASGVFNNIATIALPKISRQDFSILQKTLPKKVFLFSGALFFAAILYCLLIPYLFLLVFPEYPESVLIAQILSALFVLAPFKVFSQALIAHDFLKAQYTISLSNPALFAIALLLLTPSYGTVGVAIAIVLISVYAAGMNYLFFRISKD